VYGEMKFLIKILETQNPKAIDDNIKV